MGGRGEISCAGFVLTGGRSSRMGTDKAMLEWEGAPLVQRIARRVAAAAGNVTLIGRPERYAHLGFSVLPDAVEDCGPLGGLITALRITGENWNLLLACDMPSVTEEFLRDLIDASSQAADFDAVVPETGRSFHPLCAVYHRRVLPLVEQCIANKSFKMHYLLDLLRVLPYRVRDASVLSNVNTAPEWEAQRSTR